MGRVLLPSCDCQQTAFVINEHENECVLDEEMKQLA